MNFLDGIPLGRVNVADLQKRFEPNFRVKRLPDVPTVPRTAVFQAVAKDRKFGDDRRLILVGWTDRPPEFGRGEDGRIITCPPVEEAYLNAIRALAAYRRLEPKGRPHLSNRPMIYATGYDPPISWSDEDGTQPNLSAFLRIARRLEGLGDHLAAFGTRIFVDLVGPDGQPIQRIVRYIREQGQMTARLMAPKDQPVRPRTYLETRTIRQRAEGKMSVDERLNRFFAGPNWEEIKLESAGWDQPGRDSGVKIGSGTRQGRKVFFAACDFRISGGAVDRAVGEKIAWILRRARQETAASGRRAQFVCFLDSGGAAVDKGLDGLLGAAATLRDAGLSRRDIDMVNDVLGPCAGMTAYKISVDGGIVLFFVGNRTESLGTAFVTGPDVLEQVKGVKLSKAELGGAQPHMSDTLVADGAFKSEEEVLAWAGAYLDFLAGGKFDFPRCSEAFESSEKTGLRTDVRRLVDGGRFGEVKPAAGSVLLGFGRVEEQNFGIMMNNRGRWEEFDYPTLRSIADFVRHCRDKGLPILIDQRSPWLFGDRMREPPLARWSDDVRHLLHQIRATEPIIQYSILHPDPDNFHEGHADASSDITICVKPPAVQPDIDAKIAGYADIVVDSDAEAYQRAGLLEKMLRRPEEFRTDDPVDRKTGLLLEWTLPEAAKEPYDAHFLIQGSKHFQVTKLANSEQDLNSLFQRMVQTDTPPDLVIHQNREVAGKADWISAASPLFPQGYSYRAYRTGDGKTAVQFKLDNHHIPGLFDKDGPFVEYRAGMGQSLIAGWTFLNGKMVGVLANNPKERSGVANIESAEKKERFRRLCQKMGIPLVNLVFMPGFEPGDEEIIDIGGDLLLSEIEFTEGEVTLVVGLNTGGGYIECGSKFIRGITVEQDGKEHFIPFNYNLALPVAMIMVMGAPGAIKIVKKYREMLDAAPAEGKAGAASRAEALYLAEVGNPSVAKELGAIDEVVPFEDARAKLVYGLEVSEAKVRAARELRSLDEAGPGVSNLIQRYAGPAAAARVRELLEGARVLHLQSMGVPIADARTAQARGLLESLVKLPSPS